MGASLGGVGAGAHTRVVGDGNIQLTVPFENGYAPGGALTWFVLHRHVFQLTVSTGVGPPTGQQIDAVNRILATLRIRED
jgi:hypothetical protein